MEAALELASGEKRFAHFCLFVCFLLGMAEENMAGNEDRRNANKNENKNEDWK